MRSTILADIKAIMLDNGKVVPRLDDDVVLLETEFDSLCFALLVARMEDRAGIDPFATMETAELPITIGDLVALYEHAAQPVAL